MGSGTSDSSTFVRRNQAYMRRQESRVNSGIYLGTPAALIRHLPRDIRQMAGVGAKPLAGMRLFGLHPERQRSPKIVDQAPLKGYGDRRVGLFRFLRQSSSV